MRAKYRLSPAAIWLSLFLLAAQCPVFGQDDSPPSGAPHSVPPASITNTTIPSSFFDMSAHDGVLFPGEPWPVMQIYGLRLWDSSVAWAQINTASGVYDWTTLDDWTSAAAANNVQLIYTFGQTPGWASSDPNDTSCDYSPGSCYPPNDLNSDGTGSDQHWIDFVSAIAQHAPSILYWEMWNTPHDTNQWKGTDAQLVRMVQDANTYIKKYIPNATILSPANGQLNYAYPNGNCVMPDLMAGYLQAGLGKYIDVLAFHTYYTTVPEDIVPVIQCYQSIMASNNVSSLPMWSTEGAWGFNTELPDATDQAGFLARLYLLLWSNGVQRHYWYAWDDPNTGTLEVNGTINTPGIAYEQVESWMSGRTMSTLCSENNSSIWTCGFTGPNGYAAQAVWYPGGSKSYTAPSQYVNYLDLSGVTHNINPGASVTVGNEPILLQNSPSTGDPNFSFSESNPFPEVNLGSTGTSGSLTISAEDGFTGTVTLSCPSTYGSGSCSITPKSVKNFPATATLVLNGTSFTNAGAYSLTITGTSGSLTNTFDVPFNVGDFSLKGPSTLSATAGTSTSAKLTVTSLDSYTGTVNATCNASALASSTCALSPANPISIKSDAAVTVTATITTPAAAASGTYNIAISVEDATGAPSHSLTVPLNVASVGSDFSVTSITPASQSVNPGQSATYNFNVAPVGNGSFNNPITFSCSGGPAISGCSFNPNSVTPGASSVPVVMTITTTAGTASASIHASGLFYAFALVVPGIGLFGSGASGLRRRKVFLFVSLCALVVLSLLAASCGPGVSVGNTSGGGGSQQLGTQPGTYSITVTAASGSLVHQAQAVTLIVNQ